MNDTQVEKSLANLLRGGVILAGSVVLAGGILYLWRHGAQPAAYGVFHGQPAGLRSPAGIVRLAAAGEARGLVQLGLLLLVATPVARVAFSVYAFARERDRKYVIITLVVLALLLSSLFGSRA